MNHTLFTAINSFAGKNAMLDKVAVITAEYLPFLFIAFLANLWFFKKEQRVEVLLTVMTVSLALAINFVITLLYYHPRPFVAGPVNLLIQHAPETSFPSDHGTFMLTLSLMLATCRQLRGIGILFFMMSLAGAIARVFCGVHYPFDMAGSAAVALTATAISCIFLKNCVSSLSRTVLGKYDLITARLAGAQRH